MAEELRWGFRRRGLRQLLITLFLSFFVVSGFGMAVGVNVMAGDLSALEAYRPALVAGPDPRVRIEGIVHREPLVASPTGQRGVGWVGTVGYFSRDSDGDSTFTAVCTRGSLLDVTLGEGPLARRVSFARPGDALAIDRGLGATAPILDAGELREAAVPADIAASCQAEMRASPRSLVYREGVIADGAHVEMLGCASAAGLAPCRQGHDLLTVGTIDERVAHRRRGVAAVGIFACLWNLIMLTIVGLTMLDATPRGRRA